MYFGVALWIFQVAIADLTFDYGISFFKFFKYYQKLI